MPVPSAAFRRYRKLYMTIGPILRLYISDDNSAEDGLTDAQLYPPFCRFGPLLSMCFRGQSRTFDAGNSFQQGGGSVSSYSWSSGGSGSTRNYTFSANGLTSVSCTVSDGNGASTTGTRWVKVVERPGTGASSDQAITSFRMSPLRAVLSERGWSGYSTTIEILDQSLINAFARFQTIVVYREEYEDTGGGWTLVAEGELFSGIVIRPRLIINPENDSFTMEVATVDAMFGQQGIDGDDQLFLDDITSVSNEVSDPLAGGGLAAPPDGGTANPANAINLRQSHKIPNMTLGRVMSHLINWHCLIDVDGTRYRLPEAFDVVMDWWNMLGASFPLAQKSLNIPRGPMRSALEGCLPEGLWAMYCNVFGAINISPHHAAKTTPDSNVDSITQANCYEIEPIDGDPNLVRQVVIRQSPQSKAVITNPADPVLVARYPSSAGSTGSVYQPSNPFWFTTQANGDALAQAYYTHINANARVRIRLAGTTFGLFNRFSLTLTGFSAYPWSSKAFWVESDTIMPGDAEQGIMQEIVGREVG